MNNIKTIYEITSEMLDIHAECMLGRRLTEEELRSIESTFHDTFLIINALGPTFEDAIKEAVGVGTEQVLNEDDLWVF